MKKYGFILSLTCLMVLTACQPAAKKADATANGETGVKADPNVNADKATSLLSIGDTLKAAVPATAALNLPISKMILTDMSSGNATNQFTIQPKSADMGAPFVISLITYRGTAINQAKPETVEISESTYGQRRTYRELKSLFAGTMTLTPSTADANNSNSVVIVSADAKSPGTFSVASPTATYLDKKSKTNKPSELFLEIEMQVMLAMAERHADQPSFRASAKDCAAIGDASGDWRYLVAGDGANPDMQTIATLKPVATKDGTVQYTSVEKTMALKNTSKVTPTTANFNYSIDAANCILTSSMTPEKGASPVSSYSKIIAIGNLSGKNPLAVISIEKCQDSACKTMTETPDQFKRLIKVRKDEFTADEIATAVRDAIATIGMGM